MKKHILAIGLLLSTMTPALALDVGDISSFMNSGSSTPVSYTHLTLPKILRV